eukprot:gene19474-27587_t
MFHIGFILFPNVTQLDFTGPLQVLYRLPDSQVHIISHTLEPVPSDCGLSLVPTKTFEDCPPLDLICVPGGFGVKQAMADPVLIDFLKQQASQASYITSVCTGAFVLGAAGLLKDKQATTHWAYHSLLSEVGAIPTQGRVVRDGRVFTGGQAGHQDHARPGAVPQEEPGPDQVRLGRQRQHRPHLGRDVQVAHQHQDGPHALPGLQASARR